MAVDREVEDKGAPRYEKQSDEDKKLSDRLRSMFNEFRSRRNQAFPHFRNRTVVEYMDENDAIVNNYRIKPEWKEDWQSNISDISTHAKLMAILAQMVAMRRSIEFSPRGFPSRKKMMTATILQDVHEYIDTHERNGAIDLLFMVLRALRHGTVLGFEGYKKNSFTKGIDAQFIPLDEAYPEKIRSFSMDDQYRFIWRQVVQGQDALKTALSGSQFRDVEKVPVAGSIRSDSSPFFEVSTDINNDEYEIFRVFDPAENAFYVWANGFIVSKPGTKLTQMFPVAVDEPNKRRPRIPVWKAVYEAFDDRFFYGRAFPDILKDNQDAIDFLFNAMFDKTLLDVLKPIFSGSVNEIVDDYLMPGKIYDITDVNQITDLKTNPLDLTAFRVLKELQERNTFASIDPTTSGKVSLGNPTATEIERVQEQAQKMFVLFDTFISDAQLSKYWHRSETVISKYLPDPEFEEFVLENTRLSDGRIGKKVVQLVDKVTLKTDENGFSPVLSEKNRKIMGDSEIIQIERKSFNNFKYKMKAILGRPMENSQALRRAFLDRWTTKAYQLPGIFNPKVVAKIDIENNRDLLGQHAEEALASLGSGQGGAVAGQDEVGNMLTAGSGQKALPNLRSLMNSGGI